MLVLTLILSLVTQAATTGTLILSGVVLANCNIVITPNGAANTSLNITGGEVNQLVAISQETCNNPTGYKINVKSLHGSELRHTVTPSLKTTYQLGYNGQTPITLTTNYVQVKNVTVLNTPANAPNDVRVTVNALSNAMAGTYEDTVTFQIVAN